jgi:hypothetical protein
MFRVGFLLAFLFNPEDGGDMFFRNIGGFLPSAQRVNVDDRTLKKRIELT